CPCAKGLWKDTRTGKRGFESRRRPQVAAALDFPALSELGPDILGGLGTIGDGAGRGVVLDGLPGANGDVAEQHRLGKHTGVAEVGPGDLRLVITDRADPFGLVALIGSAIALLPLLFGELGELPLEPLLREKQLLRTVVAGGEDGTLLSHEQRAARRRRLAAEERRGRQMSFPVTGSLVPDQLH